MKTMKNLTIYFALTALSMPLFTGCKKGEGDPFISLRSRKTRVVGEWTVENWKEESTNTNSSLSSYSSSSGSGNSMEEINGSSFIFSYTSSNTTTSFGSTSTSASTSNGTAVAAVTFTFSKDGTFKKIIEYENLSSTSSSTYTSSGFSSTSASTGTGSMTTEITGTWNFLGGIGEDYKEKERIILNILKESLTSNFIGSNGESNNRTESNSFANGENSEIWLIHTLKNKEMILDGEINNSGTYSGTDIWSGSSSNNSGSSTETGTITATLTQE